MLTALTLAIAIAAPQRDAYIVYMGDPALPTTRLSYSMTADKLPQPKLSPKLFGDPPQPFQFEWLVSGAGKVNDAMAARFLVFSQERKANGDKAVFVMRQLLRMWDMSVQRLNYDHSAEYDNRIVSVYLCWGGRAGGEQMFDSETRTVGTSKVDVKVNTIYIYDLNSFTDPVEMARELAHEYGHAVLPPVGGFKEPEDWGNGYLGEKLFMRWLRDGLKAKTLEPVDVMGASAEQMDAWVKKNVDPLEAKVATNGPELGLLEGQGQGAMNEYIGLTLYMQSILPPKVFNSTLRDTASTQAKDYAGAIVRTVENWNSGVVIAVPSAFKNGLWVPVGKCRVAGAEVKKRKGEWQLVVPGTGAVTLVPPKL